MTAAIVTLYAAGPFLPPLTPVSQFEDDLRQGVRPTTHQILDRADELREAGPLSSTTLARLLDGIVGPEWISLSPRAQRRLLAEGAAMLLCAVEQMEAAR